MGSERGEREREKEKFIFIVILYVTLFLYLLLSSVVRKNAIEHLLFRSKLIHDTCKLLYSIRAPPATHSEFHIHRRD